MAHINRGVRVVKKQLADVGKYPVYQNSLLPLGYYEKYNCSENTAFVISAGAAGDVGYCKTNFWAADDCLYFKCKENLQGRYLYYVLLSSQDLLYSQVRRASVPRLSREVLENLQICLPPLEKQKETVRILDRFDALCSDISAGLPAEIEARRKQYEYYRDKLLTFKERQPNR